jgi:hypothetical protein
MKSYTSLVSLGVFRRNGYKSFYDRLERFKFYYGGWLDLNYSYLEIFFESDGNHCLKYQLKLL